MEKAVFAEERLARLEKRNASFSSIKARRVSQARISF